jgi:hypothetical protein
MFGRRPQPTPMHAFDMNDPIGGLASTKKIQPTTFSRARRRGIDANGGQRITQNPNVLVEPKSICSGNNEIFHDLLLA